MSHPDDMMRTGFPHHRVFHALVDGGTEVLVLEWWDEGGTVDREVMVRATRNSDYSKPVDLVQVKP